MGFGEPNQNLFFALKKRYILDLCVSSLRRGHANLLCIVPILADDLRRGSKEWVSPSVKPLGLEKYDPIGGFCCRKVFFLLDFAQKPRFRSDFQLQLYDFDSFWYSRPFRLWFFVRFLMVHVKNRVPRILAKFHGRRFRIERENAKINFKTPVSSWSY